MVKHTIATMSILVQVRMFFLLIICSVFTVDAATTFVVSSAYENDTGCTSHQFSLKMCTAAAIRVNVITADKGALIYAYDTSKGLERSFSSRTCGNNSLTAKSEKKDDSEMLVVHVCGYSASMCPVACSHFIVCAHENHPDLDPPPTVFYVSNFVCLPQDDGETGSELPTVTTVEEVPVNVNSTETPGGTKEKPCEERPRDVSDCFTNQVLVFVITVAVMFVLFLATELIFHKQINDKFVAFKIRIGNLIPKQNENSSS